MFSKEFIRDNFYFTDDKFLYFNNGMYGICPRPVLEEKIKILRQMEENPVIKYATTMFDDCLENTKLLADRLGASPDHLAIVPNVTMGMWSILQSLEVQSGDEILITNFTYAAVKMEVQETVGAKGVHVRTLTLDLQFHSKEDIIDIYRRFVVQYPNIRYAIIDHIHSALPWVQPVKGIVQALRALGVFVIIDGAHAAGQLKDLNIRDIDADVYVGNLHKWYFAPRPTGFLALRDGSTLDVKPPVVSYLAKKELYLRFVFMGTNDFSNMLCVKYALQFVDRLGGLETMHNYIVDILTRGVAHLEKSWNVSVFQFPEMAPFVRLVPLPEGFSKHKDQILKTANFPFWTDYFSETLKKFNYSAAIHVVEDKLYFRLCCHIYLTFDHFVQLSERVLLWLQSMDRGGYLAIESLHDPLDEVSVPSL